jgi:tripartite-type tricarboxylate transporter receptor subunit TctC
MLPPDAVCIRQAGAAYVNRIRLHPAFRRLESCYRAAQRRPSTRDQKRRTSLSRGDAMPFARFTLAVAAMLTAAIVATSAQDYPARPITFVVGFPPGSSSDIVARNLGQRLAEKLGKPFVIENKPGAGSIIAAQTVAHAQPDGYTILIAPSGTIAINPALYKSLPYDPLKDFAFVAHTASFPLILVVAPQSPVQSVKDLIRLAKENPERFTFASSGAGTSIHLAGELFKAEAGIKMTHIPYKGPALAVTDIMAGHVDMIFSDPGTVVELVKSGKLRAIGVTSKERFPVLPDVPTIAEAGVPGYDASSWHMIVAPKGTPVPIVNRLHDAFKAVIALPEVKQQFLSVGLVAVDTPDEAGLRKFAESETVRWTKIVKQAGLAGTE